MSESRRPQFQASVAEQRKVRITGHQEIGLPSCDATVRGSRGKEVREMTISAKFKVHRLTPIYGGNLEVDGGEVELVPDYADGRNKDWSKYTPSGVIRLMTTNPEAIKQFQQAKAFTVLFEAEQE